MKTLKNIRGFTLIELLIVCAIAGIGISAVGSFLISNYNLFFRAEDQVNVQYEAQNAMNEIINKVMETKGIKLIEGENNSITINTIGNHEIDRIVFDLESDDLVFEHNNETIFYGHGDDANTVLSQNIESLQIKPISTSYKDCRGITITIIAVKNGYRVEVKNEVYFRNKE
ncbi:PilW family protein [Tepidibacter formicigenes]|jgi:prepilin-type N-terminal cleavage/methylation domain-containing protein|uniref:Prepilin-type N-terminal cleavage/methylation domain-containing protein n=1 Tax=Tepidibacter formicigenes DSM 15518 TaxID=1123349 RepID=A0A1M6MH72_9FIRM|nr:prepilin-type N-terminal cleavage/methylation domain-containing protein [Tepidibacter formicigenes]SHJ82842.1 prepilin-type N-terminal cleavage/methylation domain-containing protein [Tepidibacter formicigenes DSM 15518]